MKGAAEVETTDHLFALVVVVAFVCEYEREGNEVSFNCLQ